VAARAALIAHDPGGGKHAGGGLLFTWLSFATPGGRASVVLDLESTRFAPGRGDRSDRGQAAFYAVGLDWTAPFASRGTGLFLGAEATGGVVQGSTDMTPAVTTAGVFAFTPHLGGAVAYRGVGVFADAGYRLQIPAHPSSTSTSMGGPIVQAGLRVEMEPGSARDVTGWDAGYTARFFMPNGSRVYGRYGGLSFGGGSGPMLGHELLLTTPGGLPRALHMDHGVALTYLGAAPAGGGTPFNMLALGWVGTFHAFATRQPVNPYLGARLGLAYMSSGDATTFRYSKQIGAVASGLAGLDVALHRRVMLRVGVAYDAVAYANDVADTSLSGYAVEAGVVVRL
jgi:hypothetical protein